MASTDNKCTWLTEYMLGELSDSRMEDYEKHLQECGHCRSEYESLWLSHKMLLTDASSEVSNQLFLDQKSQILACAFSRRKPRSNRGSRSGTSKSVRSRQARRQRGWLFASTALVGCILAAAVIVRTDSVDRAKATPVNLLAQWSLVAAGTYPGAQGVVLEVHHRSRNNLIVYVHHVPVQSRWGCYDVWGIANGQRHSLGEFTVNSNGNGAITVTLDPKRHYEQVEITLEPSWGDTTPKGPEVLHSAEVNI